MSTLLQPAHLLHLALLHDWGLHDTDPSAASQGALHLYELNHSVATKATTAEPSRAKYVKHPQRSFIISSDLTASSH